MACLTEEPSRIKRRERKSPFVKLFDKTPPGVVCPHFYELVLSNGCPFACTYCYLRLTFRGQTGPVLYTNPWWEVEGELEAVPRGVFSTGELADSLAVIPPLLRDALGYFSRQSERYLLVLTKSTNIGPLLERTPSPQIIASFSVNSSAAHAEWERSTPPPRARLECARLLKDKGWRVRVRIDPVVLGTAGVEDYRELCDEVRALQPEMVTIGTLRQYPGLYRFSPDAPRNGLSRSPDGRMRYTVQDRVHAYRQIARWLGFQPALCKETKDVWQQLGWLFRGCNCTAEGGNGQER